MNRAFNARHAPDLAAKIAALHESTTYPERPSRIDIIETHMSYVFLTPNCAYKLKKPVRYDYLDFSTLAARERNCREELALNQVLAPGVYHDVVPLAVDAQGRLSLGGAGETATAPTQMTGRASEASRASDSARSPRLGPIGEPVEWLVKMRRLPAERMLDRRLRERTAVTDEIRSVAEILAQFYRGAPPALTDGAAHRADYAHRLEANSAALSDPHFKLPTQLVAEVRKRLARFLERAGDIVERRAHEGHVVEGHGDLRPEHVCLETPPVVFDRLEFNRVFRLVDAADELASLSMECERLGAPIVGVELFERYSETTGDRPPDELLHFYAAYRACLRARLAILHTRELVPDAWAHWQALATDYLKLARRHVAWIGK